ncbi:hypothetical protein V8E36_001656 [Tilletia maclaganii]
MNVVENEVREQRTAYEILGLSSSATLAEIRAAYLSLVRLYHPDKNVAGPGALDVAELAVPPVDASSDAPILALNEAYATLSSPESRAAYDAQLLADRSSSSSRANATGSSSSGSSQPSSNPRISAVVDLEDFEVKHIDDADEAAAQLREALQMSKSPGQAKFKELYESLPHEEGARPHHPAEQDDPDAPARAKTYSAEELEYGSSPVVFVYPCRCGHAFVVHPDDLVTAAMLSDAADGRSSHTKLHTRRSLANLQHAAQTEPGGAKKEAAHKPNSHAGGGSERSEETTGAKAEHVPTPQLLSLLSTCSGCSQVIQVVWTADDDDDGTLDLTDDDSDSEDTADVAADRE